EPLIAVNSAGDAFVAFGESGRVKTGLQLPTATEILHTIWRANATQADPIEALRAGTPGLSSLSHGTTVKALAGSVDPEDDDTFWGIHKFVASDGSWDTFVGAVTP
ncbi:MAG: hypothetical protein KC933_09925, partial [Myxococcales bacterium]|nr:hypothetical protein [Myxococcales bacterium]